MKRFVKAYDLLFEEHDFYNRVKAVILNKDDAFGAESGECSITNTIIELFHDYLSSNHSTMDVFDFTLEDREDAVDDFCDEFFSWAEEDDFAELVLQDAYKKGE